MVFSYNQKLAFLCVLFAAATCISAFLQPAGWNGVNLTPTFIDVIALAEKIKNRDSITIVDIRSRYAYEEFHVPTAIHVPPDEFITTDWADKSLIIYAGDDDLAMQLWIALPPKIKTRSEFLFGGVHDWYDRLLYPMLPIKVSAEDSVLQDRIYKLSLFYGGQPEFKNSSKIMKYYKQDISKATWPKKKRKGGLVRKGC